MLSSDNRSQFWSRPQGQLSKGSIEIIPDGEDPLAGVATKEEILANAFKIDLNPLYEAVLRRYPEAAEALAATGADPRVFKPQENIYLGVLSERTRSDLVTRYRELQPDKKKIELLDPQCFDNVGLHNVMVGIGVEAIAELIFKDDEPRKRECTLLGLVHDANKTAERQRNNLLTALTHVGKSEDRSDINLVSTAWRELDRAHHGLSEAVRNPNAAQAYDHFREFLIQRGTSTEIIDLVLRANEIAGHGSFALLTRSRRPEGSGYELCTEMLPALIVHAVDDHISSPRDRSPSLILTARERMIVSDFHAVYKFMLEEGIAAKQDSLGHYRVVDVKDIKNASKGELDAILYMDFQPLLADAINILLAQELGTPQADPKTFLRDLLVDRFS